MKNKLKFTLGSLGKGKNFFHGNTEFVKMGITSNISNSEELIECKIAGQHAFVYISAATLVYVEANERQKTAEELALEKSSYMQSVVKFLDNNANYVDNENDTTKRGLAVFAYEELEGVNQVLAIAVVSGDTQTIISGVTNSLSDDAIGDDLFNLMKNAVFVAAENRNPIIRKVKDSFMNRPENTCTCTNCQAARERAKKSNPNIN